MRRIFLPIIFLIFILSLRAFCDSTNINLIISPNIAWQGKILTVKILSTEGISKISGSFLNQKFICYKNGNGFRGVVGVPINQKTGYYDLKLIITRLDGNNEVISRKMKVWSTRFPFSKFWLKPSKNKLRARELINEEWAQIEKVLLIEEPVQCWSGKFLWPVKERISQGFGHRQIINGKGAGNHRGVDIAVPSGTEIKAPNNGKVVFAKRLKAFGGTMVLDHGQGIHTLYFHLSKLIANAGEAVEKGDIIALSGNSGISSGAHLHWGLSVHNLRVDPLQWVKYEI